MPMAAAQHTSWRQTYVAQRYQRTPERPPLTDISLSRAVTSRRPTWRISDQRSGGHSRPAATYDKQFYLSVVGKQQGRGVLGVTDLPIGVVQNSPTPARRQRL